MRRSSNKKKFIIMLFVLLIVGLGIGYAVLTQQLTINNTVSYSSMKWDVGFSEVEDYGGSIVSTSSISSDGKTITVNCDFGLSTSQESCIVKAKIINNSSFDIKLTDDPVITYDDTYIHTLTFNWQDHPTYKNFTVLKDNYVEKGETEDVVLTIKTKNFNLEMLPSSFLSIPVTITLNFGEWQEEELPSYNDLAILADTSSDDVSAFRSEAYVSKIKRIIIEDSVDIAGDAIETWDISDEENNSVVAFITPNVDSSYYDLYIQSDTQLYANEDMDYWFYNFRTVDSIVGLDLLNKVE